jgi:superfamily II DNA or RNA helicase
LKKYIKEIDPLWNGNKYENNCIKCNSKYIYTDKNQQIFKDFIDSEEQVIAISSPCGTGKTYTFEQLISNFNKILFITYRQSLANSLYDKLQKHKFQNYNELKNYEIQNAERLIIQ